MKKKWPLLTVMVISLLIVGCVAAFISLLHGVKDLDNLDAFDIGD